MILEGTIYWCRLDKPQDNYNKRFKIMKDGEPDGWGQEWGVTIGNLSKEQKLALRDAGILDRVKNKMDDAEDHIPFRLSETKRDGTPNDPVKVINGSTMKEWDWKEDGLIGNGSKGAIKFNIWKSGAGKASIFPVSLLVTEHILYETPESDNDYEDPDDWSEYAKPDKGKAKTATKTKATTYEDLDDEIPF